MAIEVWVLHAIRCVTAPSLFLRQITSGSPSPGIAHSMTRRAGWIHSNFRAVMRQQPTVSFTTPQIGALLTATGGALAIRVIGCELWFAKVTGAGTRASLAASEHYKLLVPAGMLYITDIRANHAGIAEASGIIQVVYDGTNAPFQPQAAQAISSPAYSGTDELWTLGPCSINGTTWIEGLQSMSFTTGLRPIVLGSAGELYDTYCAVGTLDWAATIECINNGAWLEAHNIPSGPLPGLSANAKALSAARLYLRAKTHLGTSQPDATAAHLLMSFGPSLLSVEDITASGDSEPVSTRLRIAPTVQDDASHPVTFTIGAALAL